MAQNAQIRTRIAEIQGQIKAEKEWWEKRKADISSGLMKELDDEATAKPVLASTASSNSVKPTAVKVGSDDDAVLVESPAQGGGKGKNKKKGKL
jgi:translocation protein SEC66